MLRIMTRTDPPAMARWREPSAPPPALEERVIAALRADGLLRSDTTRETDMKRLHVRWSVAAGVLLFVGLFAGSQAAKLTEPASADARPAFAVLLYENETYRAAPRDGERARIAEYAGWARKLAAEQRLVDAGKLSDTGSFLDALGDSALVPRAPEGVLAGYFVIRAEDQADAERIARECPHLKYGGTISLRRIETG
jgi:hypothetical protein